MIWPDSVWWSSESMRLARPKSVIFGTPSVVNSTLLGFKSRWMIPASWANWMAAASVASNCAARPARLRRAGKAVVEAAALEQLQRDVRQSVGFADVVNLNDMGVAELGDRFGFCRESLEELGFRLAAATNHLEGDQAIEAQIARLVDDTHPAVAQAIEDFVAGNDREIGLGTGGLDSGRRGDAIDLRACSIAVGIFIVSGQAGRGFDRRISVIADGVVPADKPVLDTGRVVIDRG